ncbi:MAG: imidazole glycerol phosphate synthase subunit HisH [Firmicutes bacterium]|nr:imidazole glycerol phosphate synthase subunit HisH [Bacillota bacterium]
MIAIVDYGMGNLRSVQKAFEYLGFEATITRSEHVLQHADKILLPGVGAFEHAMRELKRHGLDERINYEVAKGKPLLGICLGMQLLFDVSYENGVHNGLGILPGEIVRIPAPRVKVPQVGWNSLKISKREPLFAGLPEEPYVYFVHSYYLQTKANVVSATTFYGDELAVAAQRDNVFALQFHPEKSGDIGLQILKNFGGLK